MTDPLEGLGRLMANHSDDALYAAAGIAAAVVRVATYSGPPRTWRAIALDGTAMSAVGYAVAQLAEGMGANSHLSVGVAIISGLIGWEAIKRIALKRANKEAGGNG